MGMLLFMELLNYSLLKAIKGIDAGCTDNLERMGHQVFDQGFKQEMLRMSHGIMDWLLKNNRKCMNPTGLPPPSQAHF